MKMNVKLLRQVRKVILEEPKRVDMNVVGVVDNGDYAREFPDCGTIGCIAGWAGLLSHKNWDTFGPYERHQYMDMNYAALKLNLNEDQAARLFREPRHVIRGPFYTEKPELGWPKRFARRYEQAKTDKTRAKVVSDRIDHFIATKGAE